MVIITVNDDLPNNTSLNDVLPNNTSLNDVLPNNISINVLTNNNDSNNNNGNRESFVRPLNTEWITRKKRGNRNINVNGNDDDWNVESVNIYNSLHVKIQTRQ